MFSRNRDRQIEEEMYKLKFRQKMLTKMAITYKKNENAYYKKAKKVLIKGDERTAAIFARQSVQFADMALSTNKLACRIEVIESNIRLAIQSGNLSEQMFKTVGLLTVALEPSSTLTNLGTFDKAFEDIMTTSNGIADVLDAAAAPGAGAGDRERELLEMMNEEISVGDMSSMPMFSAVGTGVGHMTTTGVDKLYTNNNF